MSGSLLNILRKLPAPIFGNAAVAMKFGMKKATGAPKFAPWGLPLAVGGLWFVWPAVDEEWKQSIGFGDAPASAAPAAAEEKKEEPIVLTEEAQEKVEKAYVVEVVELTEDEKAVMKAAESGDFTLLEKEWDSFTVKTMNPEEDDDDDDDDDDEDDEEDEEEEDDDEE